MSTPTAPLPAAALSALARLHSAFPVVQAVTVYAVSYTHLTLPTKA